MYSALAVLVVPKLLDGQRLQMWLLLSKHCGDLALGRAVDPRVGPVSLPAIEVRLRLVDALEAHPGQRRALRVAHTGLNLALAIGVAHATGQRDGAVVGEHVAVRGLSAES
jgi:hypothetical protein